jgi:dTMP kinase
VLRYVCGRLDRTTAIGNMINAYLQSAAEMDDRCIHLLFSANRWEAV